MLILLLLFLHFSNEVFPPLNERIIEFVESVKGKQVGNGECWDLASEAIKYAGAYLDRSTPESVYIFGKQINPLEDTIFPGDIIQFENIEMRYTRNNNEYIARMPHHTAIVYKVIGIGHYMIAHQNSFISGKKVGITELDLAHITIGELYIYRPISRHK